MKKLMIALAAVAMAVVANAANVKWTTAAIYTPDANGNFTSTLGKNADPVMNAMVTMTFFDVNGTEIKTITASTLTQSSYNMTGKFVNTTSGFDFLYNETYSYAAHYTATYGGKDWEMDATGSFTQTKDKGDYNLSVATGAKWVAVPEPTSGLLLLLGVAGLALKRRRA